MASKLLLSTAWWRRRLAVNGRSLVQAVELLSQPGLPFDPPDRAPRPK